MQYSDTSIYTHFMFVLSPVYSMRVVFNIVINIQSTSYVIWYLMVWIIQNAPNALHEADCRCEGGKDRTDRDKMVM